MFKLTDETNSVVSGVGSCSSIADDETDDKSITDNAIETAKIFDANPLIFMMFPPKITIK
jgi:hypothetical protein